MKACNGSRWRPVVGVLAAGVFACALTLYGAPARSGVAHDGKARTDGSPGYGRLVTGHVDTGGPNIAVAPAVQAYRPQVVAERTGKTLSLLTIRGLDERGAGMVAARSGGPGPGECELDDECDPCDPCLVGGCVAGACLDPAPFATACTVCDDGVFCNGQEMCDGEGLCIGAEGQVRFECVGGSEAGAMCDPDDPDCPGGGVCEEVPIPTDPCARFTTLICDEEVTIGAGQVGGCVTPCDYTRFPDTCNDNKYCNGVEDCIPQECAGGTNDGAACATHVQCPGVCVGGTNPGTACTTGGGQCLGDGGTCSALCGGVCRTPPPPPCGNGATCVEANPPVCGDGRCCVPSGGGFDCSRKKLAACTATGAKWLAVGEAADTCTTVAGPTKPNAGEDFNCPKYESGIVEGSVLVGVEPVGPAGVAVCRPYQEIGDDYKTSGCVAGQWIEVTTVRWVGGFPDGVGSRMRVTFYDTAGRFIEDVITEPDTAGLDVRRTTIFSEKPVVPCEGYMSLMPALEFSPDNLVYWWATNTANVHVGTNDPAKMWRNGAAWNNPDLAEDVLAFEIVGNAVPDPLGACCDALTGACTQKLAWDCSGVFQGDGTSCNRCLGDGFVSCDDSTDCMACAGGTRESEKCGAPACPGGTCSDICLGGFNDGNPCVTNAQCRNESSTTGICVDRCVGGTNHGVRCDCPDSTCENVGPCNSVSECMLHACCNLTTGDCAIGFCGTSPTVFNPAGQPCNDWNQHSDCPQVPVAQYCLRVDPAGGDDCPSGWTPQAGYGHACLGPKGNDRNCCEQLVYTGWDTCVEAAAGDNLLEIDVPGPLEEPRTVTYTITGDNKQATFGDFTDRTCPADIFNEDGGTRDRGWWHAFSLDSAGNCSDIRIDFCCTDPIHQPQWSFLYTECDPCGGNVSYSTAQAPIGNNTSPHDRGFPFCQEDNLWVNFTRVRNGTYWLPVYTATGGHFGQYQIHITAASCPEAACCMTDGTCDEMNEPDCDDIGGYWLGFGNIPSSMQPVISCDFGACDTGSCCKGPGNCVDDDGATGPMTYAICEDFDPPGTYKGGALCEYPEPPCPSCDIMGATNCQLQPDPVGSFNMPGMADLGAPPTGTAIADDFVPDGSELTSVCVFGTYLDAKCDGPGSGDEKCECVDKVPLATESFRVRIYADSTDPATLRQPGALISEQSLSGNRVARGPDGGAGFETTYNFGMQGWTLYLDKVTLTPGSTYWLEVVSDRNVCPDGTCTRGVPKVCNGGVRNGESCDLASTCYWQWWQTFNEDVANDWSVFGTDDRPGDDAGSGYAAGSGKIVDLQWCLGGPSGPLNLRPAPEAPTGACCLCDGVTCYNEVTLTDCVTDYVGMWSLGKSCGGEGVCFSEGDSCSGAAGLVAYEGGLNCTTVPGEPGALPVEDGLTNVNTTCYNSDGPLYYGSGPGYFGKDIWFAYTATCTGKLVASMCMSGNYHGGYDSFMAIYHDDAYPNDCPCPGTIPAPPDTEVDRSDEGCNGILGGGPGIIEGVDVVPGECYTVRVGGWGAGAGTTDAGLGAIDIACIPNRCVPALSPLHDRLALPGTPISKKMRFLSFAPQEAGESGVMRVKFFDMPPAYNTWEGMEMFVGTPERYCENGGQKKAPAGAPPPNYGCGPAGGISPPWFWAATLQCDAPAPIDWGSYGMVHVFHEGIVPLGVYHVQVADRTCSTQAEESYSLPALEITMAKWGDAVKDCTTNPCGAPDNSAGIVDVTALLDKYRNLPGNVQKVRADVEGSPSGDHRVPNLGVDISDVTFCLGAFLGQQYPPPGFPPPRPRPCP